MSDFPTTQLEQAKMLENILVNGCEGPAGDTGVYQQLRTELMNDPVLRPLLPEFVRTCRDLRHFWGYIKGYAPKWEPRRIHVRDSMTPVFDHLEGVHKAPVDTVASDVLQKFDADGVHTVWEKRWGVATPIPTARSPARARCSRRSANAFLMRPAKRMQTRMTCPLCTGRSH